MKKMDDYELGLFRLNNGIEVLVKKEHLGEMGCNFFLYQHICNEEDDLNPGDIIEDKYVPLECAYFENMNTTLSAALEFLLEDLIFIRE
ncbi:hypothetical protein [Bacillus sp. ISL-7]|uniref:hypothetical protein n=1 Tax=Bacillus sp. ISL-7 TaxID=2819136 RepID=UPI001BE8880D|nr:hypothetical protein [Bacillus sp. ISL-7]MBT2739073.1 hypothetical protein [Bacillus sp. ISL-7]